jgi:hypothetical protein
MTIETLPDIIAAEDVVPYEDTDDGNEHLTHIINPPGNTHLWSTGMDAKDVVFIARMTGQNVIALCGYKWVPKRNPDKYPVCQTCMDIAGNLMRDGGE